MPKSYLFRCSFVVSTLLISEFAFSAESEQVWPTRPPDGYDYQRVENRCAPFMAELAGLSDVNLRSMIHFGRVASMDHTPYNEEGVMNYAMAIAAANHYEVIRDAYGNTLIKSPGTGSRVNYPSVMIQFHADVHPAPNAEAWKNGAKLEYKEKVVVGVGTNTSADNMRAGSTALALMERLPEDFPPVEWVITRAEEEGCVGARNCSLPLSSKVLINIDGDNHQMLAIGNQGLSRIIGEASKLSGEFIPDHFKQLDISIEGFMSGHSAVDIHLERGNTVVLAAKFLRDLEAGRIPFYVTELAAGETGAFSDIPSRAHFSIAIRPEDEIRVKDLMSWWTRNYWVGFTDEQNRADLRISAASYSLERKTPMGLNRMELKQMLYLLLTRVPNGVRTTGSRVFENGVISSTNHGFWSIHNTENDFVAKIGFMPRSHEVAEQNALHDDFVSAINALPGWTETARTGDPRPPWIQSPDSPEVRAFASVIGPDARYIRLAGGLENYFFVAKRPDLIAFTTGTRHRNIHSTSEEFNPHDNEAFIQILVEGARRVSDALQAHHP